MATRLSIRATEESTYVVSAAFTDEDGDDLIPTSITWTLTDIDGTVINEREDVEVGTPAATVYIVLTGDDLEVTTGSANPVRIVTVSAVYNSTYGSGLYLKAAATFEVENLIAVTPGT